VAPFAHFISGAKSFMHVLPFVLFSYFLNYDLNIKATC